VPLTEARKLLKTFQIESHYGFFSWATITSPFFDCSMTTRPTFLVASCAAGGRLTATFPLRVAAACLRVVLLSVFPERLLLATVVAPVRLGAVTMETGGVSVTAAVLSTGVGVGALGPLSPEGLATLTGSSGGASVLVGIGVGGGATCVVVSAAMAGIERAATRLQARATAANLPVGVAIGFRVVSLCIGVSWFIGYAVIFEQ
jgi:hypothetical protein